MISIARIFGAPESVPAGKIARVASKASESSCSVPVTVLSMCWRCEYFRTVMKSSTLTDPGFDTIRTSFLPRSTSITCSACSFSSDSSFSASSVSSALFLPRGHVPAIGLVINFRLCTVKSVSGLAPTIPTSSNSKRYMYGLGFTSLSFLYSSTESCMFSASYRLESTTWNMSPSMMCCFAFLTIASYRS